MKDIIQHQPQIRTSFCFGIGPAVDLAALDDYCRRLLAAPWHAQDAEPEPPGESPAAAIP